MIVGGFSSTKRNSVDMSGKILYARPMDPNNPHDRRPNSNLLTILNDEPEEPRDTSFMRWAKFISIIVVLASVLGGVGAWTAFRSSYNRARYSSLVEDSSAEPSHPIREVKIRTVIGAIIGGAIGACYVGRCLVRNEDP